MDEKSGMMQRNTRKRLRLAYVGMTVKGGRVLVNRTLELIESFWEKEG